MTKSEPIGKKRTHGGENETKTEKGGTLSSLKEGVGILIILYREKKLHGGRGLQGGKRRKTKKQDSLLIPVPSFQANWGKSNWRSTASADRRGGITVCGKKGGG